MPNFSSGNEQRLPRCSIFWGEGFVIPANFTYLQAKMWSLSAEMNKIPAKLQRFLPNARVSLSIPKASGTDEGPNQDLQSQLQSCQGKSLIHVPRLQTSKQRCLF